MRPIVLALCCSWSLLACGDNKSGGNGVSTDAGPPDSPTLSGDKYSITFPAINVPPGGTESTKCVWMRLDNAAEIKVHAMHNVLTDGSHHLIVYKDDMNTTEQLTPVDCDPFTGALNSSGMVAPIAITQRADDEIFLPNKVAYTFPANQMVKLEMHYINRGDSALDISATVDFYAADPASIEHEAAILFTGSPDIDLAVNETETLKQFFKVPASLDLSASKIFAITGHTHRLGTSVKVRVGESETGPFTEVYAPNPFKWDEPETATPAEFSVPTGGGFEFECTWTNTSGQRVTWGESANEEMCFFWAYYYPSQGSKVCFHTDQFGGGLDICCPGDSLCGYVEDYLNN